MHKITITIQDSQDLALVLASLEMGVDVLNGCAHPPGHHWEAEERLMRLWHEISNPFIDLQMDELLEELGEISG